MQLSSPWLVEVTRGVSLESSHQVAVSMVDERGTSVLAAGDEKAPVFPRSAIKFLQAIPFVETGAYESHSLTHRHLALACASHQAEPFQMEILAEWLNQLNLQDSDLACGPQVPSHKGAAEYLIQQKKPITRLMNNCSGKHLGLLTTAIKMREPIQDYHLMDHPVQKRVTRVLSELSQIDFSKWNYGIDGCGIPTFAIPLRSWAVAMSGLLNPKSSPERQKSVKNILAAVTQYPELVSGSEHMDLKIQKITGAQLILKSGAEGFCNGLLPEKGLAFAIKVLDGHARALPAALLKIIKDHAGFSATMVNALENLLVVEMKNTRNEIVGKISLREKN